MMNSSQVLIGRAESEIDILLPGYTHLQRAQPIRWSHFLCRYSPNLYFNFQNCCQDIEFSLSYGWSLSSDMERLKQIRARVNVMPLGSGALAGNPFAVDRTYLAHLLEFDNISPNSLLAVGDRDFVGIFLHLNYFSLFI